MSDGPIQGAKTPKFGICINLDTGMKNRCVLSKDACDKDRNESYKAPYETNLSCQSPTDVEVGRCTSSLDDKRCGPTEDACGTKSPFYTLNDPLCSLVVDNASPEATTRTTFPACTDAGASQCVLYASECFDNERVAYSKWAAEWGPHPCHCEDVPTGVCFQESTNSITPNNSHCAVSREDCQDEFGYSFMDAREFLSSERATYECRLCDSNKIGTKESFFPAGACLKSGAAPSPPFAASDFEKCAFESTDCINGFISGVVLEQHALSCPIKQTSNWGICTSSGDKAECTNKRDSCMYDFRFEISNECNIHGNSQTGLPTYFSYCAPRTDNDDRHWKDVRCVWDESECDYNKERWEEARPPNNAWFPGCTCEDVYTGVCQEPSTKEYHCAVSKDGCTDPTSYIPQRLFQERGIDMSCQLCPLRPPSAPQKFTPSVAPVKQEPQFPPTVSPVIVAPSFTPVMVDRPTISWPTEPPKASIQQSQQNDPSTGTVAGIAIGGVVACGLFVLICTLITGGDKEPLPLKKKAVMDGLNNQSLDDPEVAIDACDDSEPVPPNAVIT